jgi:hypothetical protein
VPVVLRLSPGHVRSYGFLLAHSTRLVNRSKATAFLLLPPAPMTSQPQKGAGACGPNSTSPVGPSWLHLAVGPIPPADWGTRSTRSHLGKRPEHEISDFCPRRGGPGGAPRSGPGLPGPCSPEGAGGQVGLGSIGSWRGSDRKYPAGPGGAPERAPPAGQNTPQKAGTISSVEQVARASLRD